MGRTNDLPGERGLPLSVRSPEREIVVIRPAAEPHPVLGPVDELCGPNDEILTVCGQIDWNRPERIPPVWRPSALPAGVGTAILNRIAERAEGPLRYRGPYPSAALYMSLSRCFEPQGSLAEFIAGAQTGAALGIECSPKVDFLPAPFERVHRHEVCAEIRGGTLVSAHLFNTWFSKSATYDGRLVEAPNGLRAVFELAGGSQTVVAELEDDGTPTELFPEVRRFDPTLPGNDVSVVVAAALWHAVEVQSPVLLRPALSSLRRDTRLVWSRCGLRPARASGNRIALHSGFADSALEGAALLESLARALAPVAFREAQRYAEASAPGAGS